MPFKDKEKNKVYQREWARKNAEKRNKKKRERTQELKTVVFNHYGNKCACCGIDDFYTLAIDHINNDGNEYRKYTHAKSGASFYRWIIKNNFPNDLQLLCFNCNYSKCVGQGKCIHQRSTEERIKIAKILTSKLNGNKGYYKQRMKEISLDAYGGKCSLCEESEAEFLNIDHINGGGRKHKKDIGTSGNSFYYWLKRNNFPKGYQVLCSNCNWKKYMLELVERDK